MFGLVVGAYGDADLGTRTGAAYVFRYDGNEWAEEQKLTASDGEASDYFGMTVSISGDVIVTGAYMDTDIFSKSGSAYVFRYENEQWVQKQKLLASDGVANAKFGHGVSIFDDTIIVGATWAWGSAYVFDYNISSDQWIEKQKITPSSQTYSSTFGHSISIYEDMAVIGAENYKLFDSIPVGAAHIFKYDSSNSTWVEEAMLLSDSPSEDERFGSSVSTDGNSVVVGAYFDDAFAVNDGSAFVFQKRCNLPGDFDLDDDVDEDDAEIFAGYLGQTCGE